MIQAKTILANQALSPEFAFSKMINETIYQNHPRRRQTTVETVDQWNLEKSLAFYKDRFADASDFTFIFVGDLDLAALLPFTPVEVRSAITSATGAATSA